MCHLSVLSLPLRPCVLKSFLRFRTGCHDLPVDKLCRGRGGRHLVRQARFCHLCDSGPGDELHMIFDCPALADLRAQYVQLFHRANSVSDFVWQEPLARVAHFVHKCLRRVQQRWADAG